MNKQLKQKSYKIPFFITLAIIAAAALTWVSVNNVIASDDMNYIKQEKAKQIALADAGIDVSDVTFTKCALDSDKNRTYYDVEFYTDQTEYDYEIDAKNGSIRERETESRVLSQSVAQKASAMDSASQTSAQTYIGSEKAMQIALEKAGLSADQVDLSRVELDQEDGQTVYEVEFYHSLSGNELEEYEYTIDAYTGAVIDSDNDLETVKTAPKPSTSDQPKAPTVKEKSGKSYDSKAYDDDDDDRDDYYDDDDWDDDDDDDDD